MLSYLANVVSSPLVHVPVVLVILRICIALNFYPKTSRWLSAIPIIWLYLCSLVYPSVLMIKSLEDHTKVVPLESNKWRNTDAIVVLACYYFEDNALPFVSRWANCSLQRNLQAALMYKEYNIPIYLAGEILGKHDTTPQAIHNQSFFRKMGVPEQDILIVPQGRNTETEVAALAPLLKNKYISLVTSASHMPRAIQYFEDHGLKVLPIPVEHLSRKNIELTLGLPNASSLYRSERAIHEYLGLIYQQYLR